MNSSELISATRLWVHKLARRLTRHRRLDPDDVAQEAFLLIVINAHQYDPARGRPMTWVTRIVQTAVARVARAVRLVGGRLRRVCNAGDRTQLLDGLPGRKPTDARDFDLDWYRQVLAGRLAVLRPQQAEYIRRRFGIEGMEPPSGLELVAAVGKSRARVHQVLSGGLSRLVVADRGLLSDPFRT